MSNSRPQITIYTDGACRGNPGPGGIGVVLTHGKARKEFSRGFRRTTNQRMELMAVIAALEQLKKPSAVDIYTDSAYVRKGITSWIHRWKQNGWKTVSKKPVKNRDLWQKLADLTERHTIRWHWVKGHAGNRENERCDQLAVEASRSRNLIADKGYEKPGGQRKLF